MNALMRQIIAVIGMNVRSLPSRAGVALVTVFAVAVVVGVLLGFLAMGSGFTRTVGGSGSEDVAIVMRDGSESELNSSLSRDQINILDGAPGVVRDASGPLASAELYVIVDGIKRQSNTRANLPFRGIGARGVALREGVVITRGRMFRAGTNEMIVGEGVLREFDGFELGAERRFNRASWKVVGVFSMQGSVFESELWADTGAVQSLFQRGNTFQTMRLKMNSPQDMQRLRTFVANDPRLKLEAKTEAEYFAAQAERTSDLIMYLGWPLGIAMAFGALAGALNTMYASVSMRTREIATLRALGFSGTAAFAGTLAESMLLSIIGGVCGALAAWLLFNGMSASTLGGSFTQVVFRLDVSLSLVWQGALLALVIGLIGGVFPAWRAARLPVAAAFRAI
jgi:putative ABC transport system permease protein